jgi:hypothetical protein
MDADEIADEIGTQAPLHDEPDESDDEDDNIHYNLRSVICVSCDYFDLFTMIYIDEFIKMNFNEVFII